LAEAVPVASLTDAESDAVLRNVAVLRAQLAAFEASVVEGRAARSSARRAGRVLPGARSPESDDPAVEPVDDWLPDELSVVLAVGRGTATQLIDRCTVLVRQLPAVWAALADGLIDEPRARAIGAALGYQRVSFGGPVADAVVDAVQEQALGWAQAGMLPAGLKERVAAAVIAADPAAADRRRKLRARSADVRARSTGDGMADLVASDLTVEDAAAMAAQVDAFARAWQADGDSRPIGMLRAETLKQLVLRPWERRDPVFTQVVLRADLPDGGGTEVGDVDGMPVPPQAVQDLLARIDALRLTDPASGRTQLEVVDPGTGELLAVAGLAELRRVARRGAGLGPPPPTEGYEPTVAQRRFLRARDQHCRFPGCRRPARFCDADHVCPFGCGGATDCPNLCSLCRRHHRLKTHAPGWVFAMEPDGTLHVTTPTGITRTTRPPGLTDPLHPPEDDPPPF
jgi:hypothetical protein